MVLQYLKSDVTLFWNKKYDNSKNKEVKGEIQRILSLPREKQASEYFLMQQNPRFRKLMED